MVTLESKKLESILYALIGVLTIVVINQLSARLYFRFDLTEEKRYSISEPTQNMLEELDEVVYVDVYLEGDLPAGVKRLQKGIKETLEEFKAHAGQKLQFRFIDPSTAKSEKARKEFYESLIRKGIQATNLYDNVDGKRTQTLVFPGAMVTYGTREMGVTFLKGNKSLPPQEQLNQSVEGVEFELASAMKSLTQPRSMRIAILRGHGELDTLALAGLSAELIGKFKVFPIDLTQRPNLMGFDAVIMAKPTRPFSESDKYKIDQFVMRGGKAVFLIDALHADMDSAGSATNLALPYETNLDDLFFKYGFRINHNLVLDMNAAPHPVVVGNLGQNPQIKLLPWHFYPIVNDFSKHPAVRNLDAVVTRFVGTVDTVKADGIAKTPLIKTSKYSKVLSAPVRVSIDELRKEMKPEFFNSGPQTIAWLFEGTFTSLYKNRFLPGNVDQANFVGEGSPAKILIISDGDIAANDINPKTGQPVELGYDQFTETRFANATLLSNLLTYMLDENGIINTRAKEVKIRLLDTVKIKNEKLTWQLVNLVLPIVFIVIFGLLKYFWRKRKYASFK
ncbi:MAG: gliding motility-associated ABC transporter substrate-binding protein GldG [Cyclobacteriaceae bacterium]|nr:gliding motility-associated ABC transporter substrate-binding protein GldG [Cyclobacteriaceae bacterium]